MPNRLEQCLNIQDLRELARRRLPRPVFDYLEGGAETEVTVRRNTLAFDEQQLIPKCLVDVTRVTTATRLLGQDVQWPVFCSPTGGSRLYHPEGELAVARAAAKTGTLYGLSVMSTHSLEAVASIAPGPRLFQLLIFKDRGLTRELMARAKSAGYTALCVTVDAAVRGKRERELRTGLGMPLRPSLRTLAVLAQRPGWFLGQARAGSMELAHLSGRGAHKGMLAQSRYANDQLDASVTWDAVRELIEAWQGPFAIKGILSVDDARRAVDMGATAIIVSNHGGRQLDGAASAFDVLPEIAQAIGHRAEVILDGGVRRGVHVLKALALGAKACSIGRPYLFGLAAGGEPGVTRALDILRTELVRAMQLCGATDVARIDSSLVRSLR